ncbi:MAG TPA: hypothetical protein VKI62_10220, partial [Bacteroidota bacterium]|nr:hypothetical protein [Bacteroidota bacterium]
RIFSPEDISSQKGRRDGAFDGPVESSGFTGDALRQRLVRVVLGAFESVLWEHEKIKTIICHSQVTYILENLFISLETVREVESLVENEESYDVEVTMRVSKQGKEVDQKHVDFGLLKKDQVKGLADLFSMMSANIEYIKNLAPQFEKIDKTKPAYLQ